MVTVLDAPCGAAAGPLAGAARLTGGVRSAMPEMPEVAGG